jgi:dTDP-4-dehydrorhamnose reductase
MTRDLASGRAPNHPLLDVPGWWQRLERFVYGFVLDDTGRRHAAPVVIHKRAVRPLVIAGASTPLGRSFAELCERRGITYHILTWKDLDITRAESVDAMLQAFQPWAIVNTVSYTQIDAAERNQAACYRVNVDGASLLAARCAAHNIALLTFSSDLVFDGGQHTPYLERDTVAPLNVYGATLAAAEVQVLDLFPAALVVRTSMGFSPWDQHNVVTTALGKLAARQAVFAADDQVVSPTYAPDLVDTCLDLLIDGECGVWHLSNQGAITWADLVREAAQRAGLDRSGIVGQPASALGLVAPRPRYSVLSSERGCLLPTLEHALDRYVQEQSRRGVACYV